MRIGCSVLFSVTNPQSRKSLFVVPGGHCAEDACLRRSPDRVLQNAGEFGVPVADVLVSRGHLVDHLHTSPSKVTSQVT